jgi:hypothetical protein
VEILFLNQVLILLKHENFNNILGSFGEPERVEPEHEQADGPRHEDHSPHQQGGDGQC